MLKHKLISGYKLGGSRRQWLKLGISAGIGLILLVALSIFGVRRVYLNQLKPVNNDQTIRVVTIPTGSSVGQIGSLLKNQSLIKSSWAFEWYVRSKELGDDLLAGTYALRQSQSIPEIVDILKQGKIATDLVTILPARRLDQIKADLINYGFDQTSVDAALNPANYPNHPALVDKPVTASLEGYLYPESFQKTAETTPQTIIRQSLDEMAKRLTPSVRAAFAAHGLNTHQAIIMASIVEQEVSKPEDRAQVAQVFYSRLHDNLRLQSDVTAYYGAILANQPPSTSFDSAYNTYLHDGLPVGPISNVSEDSLKSVANPAPTDWLYFVAGDDGNTYFSRTLEEHQALTAKYCKKLCHQ